MAKILVIEDELESRDVFLEILKMEGFEVIGAENGLEGVHKAEEHLPDLVICDIMMPELDGYGVLTTLRQKPATAIIPLIFLTGKATKAEFREGMKLGADDYITKPTTVQELLGAIAAQLEKQAAQKRWYATTQKVIEPQSTETKLINPESFHSCPQISQVFDFIEANYHQPIGLEDVAQAVGYSPAYLTDLVRRLTGQTLHRWIVQRRMKAACSLLIETDQSIEQIATIVGYRYVGCFFRQFRQSFETTPQAWRNTQREECGVERGVQSVNGHH
jgi:YesN/AraC family two-component response regulator